MELDVNKGTKLSVIVVILAVFAVIAWRVGAPDSFNKTLADAGLVQQAPAPAPAPASVPEQAPAAPSTPTPAPPPDHPQDTTTPH